MGFTSQQINRLMDTVACLHLASSKVLIQVVDELELFASFSTWLRYEIDRLASDSSSSPSEDAAEKESFIDHSKVLTYLQTIMVSSPLAVFLDDSPLKNNDNWSHDGYGLPMFELLDKQIQLQERGKPYIKSLPRIDLLCAFLDHQAHGVFGQIAQAEKRNVLFGKAQDIGSIESNGSVDMRMSKYVGHLIPCNSPLILGQDHTICQTHIAFVPKGSHSVGRYISKLVGLD